MTGPDAVPLLDATARRLEAVLRREQAQGRLPSVVAGVMRDGALVWSSSAGSIVRRDSDLQPTAQTQYRIGSITKTMTALLVMQLRDEGALSLADRLDAHLPGAPFGYRTLRQLITHSSGMSAEPPGSWWERSDGRTWEELAAALAEERVALRPDQRFHYSNVAFALLGRVVGVRRGSSWAEALDERLLRPLGMTRTSVLPESPAAVGFSVHPFARTLTDEPSHDSRAMAPAGQVWSTVEDLARYAAFLADPSAVDPAADVISSETLEEMTVVRTSEPADAHAGTYGLGIHIAVEQGRTYYGHTGSMPGFLAGVFVDRTRKSGAVVLANSYSGLRAQGLPIELLRLVEECEPTLPSAWTPNEQVDDAVLDVLGVWYFGNTALTFSYDGSAVVVAGLGSPVPWCTFRTDGADAFVGMSGYFLGEKLAVVRRGDGSVGHLECATFIFTRRPYDPDAPIPG